jgi:hypothetical protein
MERVTSAFNPWNGALGNLEFLSWHGWLIYLRTSMVNMDFIDEFQIIFVYATALGRDPRGSDSNQQTSFPKQPEML